jgi:hypothetical protein
MDGTISMIAPAAAAVLENVNMQARGDLTLVLAAYSFYDFMLQTTTLFVDLPMTVWPPSEKL